MDTEASLKLRRLQRVRIYCRDREIEYNINTDFHSKIPEIETEMKLLNSLCNDQFISKPCTKMLDILSSKLTELKSLVSQINIENIIKRKKRFTENAITKANNNTADFILRTIQLTDFGYNDLKNIIEDIRKQLNCAITVQNKVIHYVGYININAITYITHNLIERLTELARNILDIMIDEKAVHSLRKLIPLKKLETDLSILNKNAKNENCTVPIYTQGLEVYRVLSLSIIKTKVIGSLINVKIQIPTYYWDEYLLYEPLPEPVIHREIAIEVVPVFPYYLMHMKKARNITVIHSIALKQHEKENCIVIFTDILLCKTSENIEITFVPEPYEHYLTDILYNLFVPNYQDCLKTMKNDSMDLYKSNCLYRYIQDRSKIIPGDNEHFYFYMKLPTLTDIQCNQEGGSETFIHTGEAVHKGYCSFTTTRLKHLEHKSLSATNVETILRTSEKFDISYKEILKTDFINTNNLTKEIRNLKPDFKQLNEDITLQKNVFSQTLPQWKLRDNVLIISLFALLFFLTATWIFFGYHIYKMQKAIDENKYYMQMPPRMKELNSMKRISERLRKHQNKSDTLPSIVRHSSLFDVDNSYRPSTMKSVDDLSENNFKLSELPTLQIKNSVWKYDDKMNKFITASEFPTQSTSQQSSLEQEV